MTVCIVTEAELRQCVGLDAEVLGTIEDCFTWLGEGRVTMPPIMHIDIPEHNGVMDITSAYVKGEPSFAIKVGSGFFDNHLRGLPSSSAMMVLVSAETGFVEALLLDNGYLTDLRTGAAGAVAARHLAPAAVDTVGVFGAGAQARYQVAALKMVRDFRRLLVRGRSPERLEAYIAEMAAELGVEVREAESPEELVRESQVVVTTTPAEAPIVEAAWLHPSLHLTAMGSDTPAKQELAAEVLARADVVVCDRASQCFECGELRAAKAAGALSETSQVIELGELTSGARRGRTAEHQVTVCDLTGTGVQDTAIALMAYRRARERGLGTEIAV